MATCLERSVQQDIDPIRAKVREMAALAEDALRDGLKALEEKNRVLPYSVILRAQRIDELEKEAEVEAANEATYRVLRLHVEDLVSAVLGGET